MKTKLRKGDEIYRYGGEEFLIFFNNTQTKHILNHMHEIRKTIEQTVFLYDDKKIQITISIGLTQFDCKKHSSFATLLNEADQCLYTAKKNGRNRVILAN